MYAALTDISCFFGRDKAGKHFFDSNDRGCHEKVRAFCQFLPSGRKGGEKRCVV